MKKSILNTLFLAVCWVGAYSQAQAAEKLKLDKPLKGREVIHSEGMRKTNLSRDRSITGSTSGSPFLPHITVNFVPEPPPLVGAKAPTNLGAGKTRVAGLSAASNNPLQSLLNSVPTVVTPPPPVPPVNPNALRTNIQHNIQTNENAARNDELENVNPQTHIPPL